VADLRQSIVIGPVVVLPLFLRHRLDCAISLMTVQIKM